MFFSTKLQGHLHLQCNAQVYNVRIPEKTIWVWMVAMETADDSSKTADDRRETTKDATWTPLNIAWKAWTIHDNHKGILIVKLVNVLQGSPVYPKQLVQLASELPLRQVPWKENWLFNCLQDSMLYDDCERA